MQIPPKRLRELATPGRDRSVRDLAYHIYQIPEAFLDAVERGIPDLAVKYNEPPPDNVTSVGQIAAFGEKMSRELEAWWAALPDKSCRQTVKTYYGERPLHELLERCTWHSAQHARQIIAVLEADGVAVDKPLTQRDYAGLPLPEGLWA